MRDKLRRSALLIAILLVVGYQSVSVVGQVSSPPASGGSVANAANLDAVAYP